MVRKHCFYLLALACLVALPSFAQDRPREQFATKGKLRGVAAGVIQVASDDNETWTIKLPQKADETTFSGNADLSFLKPGMLVKFVSVLNKKGQAAEPITQLVIFTPVERTDVGIWPDRDNDGGANPLENLFTSPEKKEEPKGKSTKKIAEDQPYRIGGTLVSLKSGKMVVSAGGVQVKAELAENAKIRVSTNNLAFAQVGDKVEVSGWYYANAKQAGAWANTVSVTAANTLEGEKKKTRPTDDADADKKDDGKKPQPKE
jgi:hypothetical protein